MSHLNGSRLRPASLRLAAVATALLVGGLAACGDSGSDGTGSDGTGSEGTGGAEGSATGAGDSTPLVQAAEWLVGNLNDDDLLENTTSWEGETSTTVDHGSSVDLALALSATGQQPDVAAAITDAVGATIDTYVGTGSEVYSGATAKALVLALDQERDPSSFGGLDLQARVEETVATEGRIAGRLQDASEYGDYANSIGQAYAAHALTRLDSDRAGDVLDYLLAQQCEEGFFRLEFPKKGAADQACDADGSVTADQAPDTTALVVLQLAALEDEAGDDEAGDDAGADETVEQALEDAGAWLLEQQADDGSFADPQNGRNANTTGLAGWALLELGEEEAAAEAASWLRDLQVVDEEGELAGETGAIAYDEASLADAREHGLGDPLDRSPWVIAGVQAFPVLAAAPAEAEQD